MTGCLHPALVSRETQRGEKLRVIVAGVIIKYYNCERTYLRSNNFCVFEIEPIDSFTKYKPDAKPFPFH